MKTTTLMTLTALIGTSLIASAQPEGKGPRGPKGQGGRELPPEVIEKFDKDGDGKLNDEEREAARAARKEMMEKRRAELLDKYDTDGDGKLSKDERAAIPEEDRPKRRGGKGGKGGPEGKNKGPRGPKGGGEPAE